MGFKFFKIICKREAGGNVAVPDIFSYTVAKKKKKKRKTVSFSRAEKPFTEPPLGSSPQQTQLFIFHCPDVTLFHI